MNACANIESNHAVEGTLAEERPIAIPHRDGYLTGSLALVPHPDALVLVANDRGCSRHSPAERALSAALRRDGFATALVDLLLPEEAGSSESAAWMRLQVQELARRIGSARDWVERRPELARLPVVLFGQGAGAGAALLSAGAWPAGVAGVIACGGVPETAGAALGSVRVPTLLLVETAADRLVPVLRAQSRLTCKKSIAVLPRTAPPETCGGAAAAWIRGSLPLRTTAQGLRAGAIAAPDPDRGPARPHGTVPAPR